jgi:hypothetical protein
MCSSRVELGRVSVPLMLVNLEPQLSGVPDLSAGNDTLLWPAGALVAMAVHTSARRSGAEQPRS